MSEFYYDIYHKVKNSSNLAEVWYSTQERVLYVKFLSGTVAGYKDVPLRVFNEFETTIIFPGMSAGSFYSRNIRNQYKGINSDGVKFIRGKRPKAYVPQTKKEQLQFTVTGWVPVSVTVRADSLEEAIELFKDAHSEGRVSEAKVTF